MQQKLGIELTNPQAHGNQLGSRTQSTYFSETDIFEDQEDVILGCLCRSGSCAAGCTQTSPPMQRPRQSSWQLTCNMCGHLFFTVPVSDGTHNYAKQEFTGMDDHHPLVLSPFHFFLGHSPVTWFLDQSITALFPLEKNSTCFYSGVQNPYETWESSKRSVPAT
ncbi:hypothetical protein OPV22_026108 [Ensete ventricosum]|uniref:GATA-type domain-containing protein n=1 Tax=Ensete ventricosum TaxID=4639 RepID=A0AAV8P8Q6_ENSVE|nr:hypothetical protein OPV22_026108 [Ensete ventricosum]